MLSFGGIELQEKKTDLAILSLSKRVRCVRMGSCARELCLIACGKVDLLVKQKQSIWDFAAGKLILREANAELTDFNGEKKWDWSGKNSNHLIASNKILHERFLKEFD